MHRMWKIALVALASVVFAGAALADDFNLTGENTTITFLGTKPGGKHDGGFKKVTGKITVNGDKTAINVEIDVNSIYSDVDKLTTHLKSPDFFNAKKNPTAKFVSTSVEKKGDGVLITGDLTLNGQTKKISFPATLKSGADGVSLDSKFAINRFDFAMNYGKGQVDEKVSLTVSVKAKK